MVHAFMMEQASPKSKRPSDRLALLRLLNKVLATGTAAHVLCMIDLGNRHGPERVVRLLGFDYTNGLADAAGRAPSRRPLGRQ